LAIRVKYLIAILFCSLCWTQINAQFSEGDLLKEADALFEAGKYAEAMPKYSQ
jgi:hypothetical protein